MLFYLVCLFGSVVTFVEIFKALIFFDILGTLSRLMKIVSRNYSSCVVKVNQFANYVQINIPQDKKGSKDVGL
jgi:hypothetical protein